MLFDKRFELVSVNPGIVFGESLTNSMSESAFLMKQLLNLNALGYPRIQIPCVDVKDVAQALYQSVIEEKAAYKRFLLVQDRYWLEDIGMMMNDFF